MNTAKTRLLILAAVLSAIASAAIAQESGYCGDRYCAATEIIGGESCETCPEDCGACSYPVCGNWVCEVGEGCSTCPDDCGSCPSPADSDGDRVPDSIDNCRWTANADQADCDHDGTGNLCDSFNGTETTRGPYLGSQYARYQVGTYCDFVCYTNRVILTITNVCTKITRTWCDGQTQEIEMCSPSLREYSYERTGSRCGPPCGN